MTSVSKITAQLEYRRYSTAHSKLPYVVFCRARRNSKGDC